MKWKKLGQIFNLKEISTEHYFAQSPQAIVLENSIRIFFASRILDAKGKFLSYIHFVDYSKDLKKMLGISKDPVLELGKLGSFDEHGIFPMNVLKVNDQVYGYTTGWNRRKSVSVDAAIGLAISDDNGLSFKRYSTGPVLAPSTHEPFLVGDAFVQNFNNKFHMWYIHGCRWIEGPAFDKPERVYKIAHAISENGINWTKTNKQLISDKIGSDECQALPSVIKVNDLYHMYFCYRYALDFRAGGENSYRIGYAYSSDLENWTRDDSLAGIDVGNQGWDSEMTCYPFVFSCDEKTYMLYNGNEFGKHGFGAAILDIE